MQEIKHNHEVLSSSSDHEISSQVEAYIIIQYHHHTIIRAIAMKKVFDTSWDVSLVLVQIKLMLIRTGLLSPARILFSRQIQGISSKMRRALIFCDYDDDHYVTLRKDKRIMIRIKMLSEVILLYLQGLW